MRNGHDYCSIPVANFFHAHMNRLTIVTYDVKVYQRVLTAPRYERCPSHGTAVNRSSIYTRET